MAATDPKSHEYFASLSNIRMAKGRPSKQIDPLSMQFFIPKKKEHLIVCPLSTILRLFPIPPVLQSPGIRSSMSQSMCQMKFPLENSPTFAPSLLLYHAPSKSCGSNDEWTAKCEMADSGIMMSFEWLVELVDALAIHI